jgi:prephenate dehydratase
MDERAERILYLGPEGTFTHTAAKDLAPAGRLLIVALAGTRQSCQPHAATGRRPRARRR